MAEAYIELAAIPIAADATQMHFPSHLRRSTKNLNKVSGCCLTVALASMRINANLSAALHSTHCNQFSQ